MRAFEFLSAILSALGSDGRHEARRMSALLRRRSAYFSGRILRVASGRSAVGRGENEQRWIFRSFRGKALRQFLDGDLHERQSNSPYPFEIQSSTSLVTLVNA